MIPLLRVALGVFGLASMVHESLALLRQRNVDFSVGSFQDASDYGAVPYMQIPLDGENLSVPKAFYHYTQREVQAKGKLGIPDTDELVQIDTLVANNRREINGIYLPLPNMEPINLHFINQKTFEKGLDTMAHEESPESVLHRAKRICVTKTERECESALLRYHRLKSAKMRRERRPLHEQLLSLGEFSSSARVRDREGEGLGVVVGVPGYDPLYLGTALGHDNSHRLNVRFSPPA